MKKKIGLEITRRYVVEVDENLDPSDWRRLGELLADTSMEPIEIDILGWELSGSINSPESDANYELAFERRTRDVMAEFNAELQCRSISLLS